MVKAVVCLSIVLLIILTGCKPTTFDNNSKQQFSNIKLEDVKKAKPRVGELIMAIAIFLYSCLLMSIAHNGHPSYQEPDKPPDKKNGEFLRYLRSTKVTSIKSLFFRDVGPLSFDVSTHGDRAEVTEYRGLLHWHRDVIEKFLSLFLIAFFSLFLAKGFGYMFDYITGDASHFQNLCTDIAVTISIVGLALIIDGLVLVAGMTDAPGIGRTLDSLIVVLAGIVVMMIEVKRESESFFPKFSLSGSLWLAPTISGIIGVLFLVRWIVRHHTIADWKGK